MISTDNLILLGIAALNAFTAYMAWQTKGIALKTELNTNSMKDALVETTRAQSRAEGVEEGRLAGEQKAATLARGRLEGKEAKP